MTDQDWREIERDWQTNPGDYELFKRMLSARRHSGNIMELELFDPLETTPEPNSFPTIRDMVIAEMDARHLGLEGFSAAPLSAVFYHPFRENFKVIPDARQTGLWYYLIPGPEFSFDLSSQQQKEQDEQVLLVALQGDAFLIKYFAEEFEPFSIDVRPPLTNGPRERIAGFEFRGIYAHTMRSTDVWDSQHLKIKTYSAWKPPGYTPKE